MTKTGIFTYFGAQSGPKIGPLMPIFFHTFKSTCNEHVKQYCCETSENILRKWPNTRDLTNFGAQNGPQIGPLRHIAEGSSNKYINQAWCDPRANFLTKYSKTLILTHLEAQKFGPLGPIFYTPTKIAPMSLQIKFPMNIAETFQENRQKPLYSAVPL